MPTIFTHPAVALLKPWFPRVPRAAIAAAAVCSIVPDADVAAFRLGIPYAATFGHRGFTHSILFAGIVALIATAVIRPAQYRVATFAFLFLCTLSHGLLDACTDGGLGVALLSPFSNHRYFFAFRPIHVSAIGTAFFSARALRTLTSEVIWVWLPCAIFGLTGWAKSK